MALEFLGPGLEDLPVWAPAPLILVSKTWNFRVSKNYWGNMGKEGEISPERTEEYLTMTR